MALVWAVLMLAGAIGLLGGIGWLSVKIRRQREQLDVHRPSVDLEREINAQHIRSQDFFQF